MVARCWTLTVLSTAIPALASSITSCQRFPLRPEFGTFAWAGSGASASSSAGENRLEVHLHEGRPPALDAFVWNDLGCPDLLGRALAPSGFDEAEDAVPAPFEPVPSLAEHCDGLGPRRPRQARSGTARGENRGGERVRRLAYRVDYLPVAADGVRLRRRCRRGIE
jgi:hypothetical protein